MNRSGRSSCSRRGDAGLTLVEVMVALALFALIGAAGLGVLDQVLRVQSRTEGRLQHLAQMQRTLHLLTQDFMQSTGRSLGFADGTGAFRRSTGESEMAVRYGLDGATLTRRLSGRFGEAPARQALLTGVSALTWRFYSPEVGWTDIWPPEPSREPGNPAAISLDISLAGPGLSGNLRRIAILPAEAAP